MKLLNIGFGNMVSTDRLVVIMDSDHIVLSAIQPDTVAARLNGKEAVEEEEQS